RHTRFSRDWSSDVCSSDLALLAWTVRPRPGELKGSGEGVALLLLLLAANEAVFGGLGIAPTGYYPAALALFPLLVWGALRFGMQIGRASCRERVERWAVAV